MQNNETPVSKSAAPEPPAPKPAAPKPPARDPRATDQWWRPDIFEGRTDALVRRADMVKRLREFFDRRGYVEVDTPALQMSPGMEPHLTAFETTLGEPGGERRPVYLHTSPEFAMKKLLAAGMQRIFQLARVFTCPSRGGMARACFVFQGHPQRLHLVAVRELQRVCARRGGVF